MTASPHSKHAITFVWLTVFLDMVGFGLIIPVTPQLITEVGHTDLANAALVSGWMFFAFSFTQFLFGPTLGNLADAYGRRVMLLLAVFGLGVDYLLSGFAPNLWWLFVGRAFAGLCGSSYIIANAYITDITAPENRAAVFGKLGAAFGLGFVIGPAIGGLLGEYGPRIPFFAAAAISLLNFVYGYFVLPETLPPEKRRPFEWARANPLGTFKVFQTYNGVIPLCIVLFIFFFATSVYPAIWPFWSIAKFQWSSTMIGITLAAFGILMALTQGLLTGPAVKWLGERKLALVAMIVGMLAMIGYGLATSVGVVVALLIFHSPEGFAHPMLTAIMSKEVPDNAQGEMQGGIGSVMNIAMLLGTVFFSQVFGYFMKPSAPVVSPDVAYFVGAATIGIAIIVYWLTGQVTKRDATTEPKTASNNRNYFG